MRGASFSSSNGNRDLQGWALRRVGGSAARSQNVSDSLEKRGRCASSRKVGQPLQERPITLVRRPTTSAIPEVSADRIGLFRT